MDKKNSQIIALLNSSIDAILPPRCPISGDIVDRQGMISPDIWAGLDFISSPICNICGIPLGFEVGEAGNCLSCLENPPNYSSSRSALIYNDASRDLILSFKHGDKTHIVSSFVPWMMRAGSKMFEQADFLIPVPLHHMRLISRRYNQAALLADALARASGILSLSLALKRIRFTPSQGHLSQSDRLKNVYNAFELLDKYKDRLIGKNVILIDDVYTTGATTNECSRILLSCGVKKVHVLTLARVVNDR